MSPLECGANVRACEVERHFEDAAGPFNAFDPKRSRPLRTGIGCEALTGGKELREPCADEFQLLSGEAVPVAEEALGKLELQLAVSSVPKMPDRPSRPSTTVVLPALMSASAWRS